MREIGYDRSAALEYASEWALKRNPAYMNFHSLGGDCTNFCSQCLYAGAGQMNRAKRLGWYYVDAGNRAPSWSGVHFFHEFLTVNKGKGPYGQEVPLTEIEPGDFLQLGDGRRYYHSLLVTWTDATRILVATHSIDAYNRRLDSYDFVDIRAIKILGARK